MDNIIGFPSKMARIDAKEIVDDLVAALANDEIQHLLVVTMDKDTATGVAMTTSPAHCLVYMNQFQRLKIEELMRLKGMI